MWTILLVNNRKTFTQIQGLNSSVEGTEACSVIQGSKLSGFLFTIFSIETPLLPKILKDAQIVDLILEMTIPQYYGIAHMINQYVDDSTNLIASETKKEMTSDDEWLTTAVSKTSSRIGLSKIITEGFLF